MRLLRQYVRSVLVESRFKQMAKSRFTDLKAYLTSASFLDADPEGDLDADGDWTSPAAQELRDNLNDYFDRKFSPGEISAIVKVDMMPSSLSAGKDKALKGASYYFDGLHNVEIIMSSIDDAEKLSDVSGVAQKVYEVVSHELLHMQQFLKFSKGKPTIEKWNEFKKKYQESGGSSAMQGDYFFFEDESGLSELETFSLQMALELSDALGKSAAVSLLQKENPDYDTIRDNSASFRDIENRSSDLTRPELRDMIKRAKQYAKKMP